MFDLGKRLFDVLASAAALAVLALPLLALWALVRLTSRGPGLYVQPRVGRGGRLFPLLKFRTMRADHVHDPSPHIVISDAEPDLTPLGRFLRRAKLDELPQLLNVLAGQMSLVGPRPTLPEQVEKYGPFERRRLAVRPGITGLAQVHGGTGLSWPERIEWDVYYVGHRSFRLDLWILWRTLANAVARTDGPVLRLSDAHPEETRRR